MECRLQQWGRAIFAAVLTSHGVAGESSPQRELWDEVEKDKSPGGATEIMDVPDLDEGAILSPHPGLFLAPPGFPQLALWATLYSPLRGYSTENSEDPSGSWPQLTSNFGGSSFP